MQSDHFALNKSKNAIFRVLQGKAETLARRGGQYSYDSRANLFGVVFAKFDQNRTTFGEDIQKIILVFFY